MILGTAGFTAALALLRMLDNRQTPDLGPLAVTGATGGVGSLAIDIFSRAGFEVHAISGKAEQADLPASRSAPARSSAAMRWRPRGRWNRRASAAASTTSAAPMLASLLAQTAPYGNVASAGLAATPGAATPR